MFALLILMELCTITVKTFFSKHIQFVYANTIISLKMRTLFDVFLHKISPFKKNNTLNWKLVVGLCKNSLTQNSVCYESDKKNPSGGKEFEMEITKLYLKINNVIYSAWKWIETNYSKRYFVLINVVLDMLNDQSWNN